MISLQLTQVGEHAFQDSGGAAQLQSTLSRFGLSGKREGARPLSKWSHFQVLTKEVFTFGMDSAKGTGIPSMV